MSVIVLHRDLPAEPDWSREIVGRSKAVATEREAASGYWGVIVRHMNDAQTLAPTNVHAVKRLVMAWLTYDRAMAHVARHGAVVPAPRTKTPMHNPWFAVTVQAGKMAATLEAELGLAPRTRDDVAKVPTPRRPTGSDRYLTKDRPSRPAPPPPAISSEDDGDDDDRPAA